MLCYDLKAAGIPYETDSGVLDFHALRNTCLSWLAAVHAPVKSPQTFARHSTLTLTLNVYTHTLHGPLVDAAGRLPDLSEPSDKAPRATGTDYAKPSTAIPGGHTGGRTGGNAARKGAPACIRTHPSTHAPDDGGTRKPCPDNG